jgi:uncharacterized membrane protein
LHNSFEGISKMKNALMVAALMAVAVLMGCQKSEPGGRAGTDTFKLSVPALATAVKQGETQVAQVTVERGETFKQAVKLEVKAPTGLQVDLETATVKPGDKGDVQLKIMAAKDAPLGEQKVMIKGTPEKGESTETEFKVTVSAK